MIYRLLGLLLFSALLFSACDSSDSSEPSRLSIPLDEGSTWSFEGVGNQAVEEATVRIGGSTTINGISYREVDVTAITRLELAPIFNVTYVVRERDNGLYIARPDTVNGDIRLFGFELQTSVSPGETYIHTDERGNSYDVSVTEQSITVPAGSFDVSVYRVTPEVGDDVDLAFIAPGVGPVEVDYRGTKLRLLSTNVQ